jgi:hypothetical protein
MLGDGFNFPPSHRSLVGLLSDVTKLVLVAPGEPSTGKSLVR